MKADLVPGTLVRNPAHPEWGLGQVQSAVGERVTVNFEHRGKLTMNVAVAVLDVVDDDFSPPGLGTPHK